MTVVSKCARVEGKVQGVWFRASTKVQADNLDITGWARNIPNGSVEVLMIGEEGNIEKLTAWLHHGPPTALVTSVNMISNIQESPALEGFLIL